MDSRLIIVAAPCPPATQRLAQPYFFFSQCKVRINVPVNRAPVVPSGCPIAITPPLTFISSGSRPSSLIVYKATRQNTSLIYQKSIYSTLSPVFANAFLNAGMGLFPIITGLTPVYPIEIIFSNGFKPHLSAFYLDICII